MTSYMMFDILTPSVFWKIWRRVGAPNFISGERIEWPWSGSA